MRTLKKAARTNKTNGQTNTHHPIIPRKSTRTIVFPAPNNQAPYALQSKRNLPPAYWPRPKNNSPPPLRPPRRTHPRGPTQPALYSAEAQTKHTHEMNVVILLL